MLLNELPNMSEVATFDELTRFIVRLPRSAQFTDDRLPDDATTMAEP